MIKEKGEILIRSLPHKNQGAVGKLLSKQLVKKVRKPGTISRHGFTSVKMSNFVRVIKSG